MQTSDFWPLVFTWRWFLTSYTVASLSGFFLVCACVKNCLHSLSNGFVFLNPHETWWSIKIRPVSTITLLTKGVIFYSNNKPAWIFLISFGIYPIRTVPDRKRSPSALQRRGLKQNISSDEYFRMDAYIYSNGFHCTKCSGEPKR